MVEAAIEDAAALGFGVLSVSGGEPLLYHGLSRILARARACGMKTQIATNGWFLDGPRFDRVADLTDLVAVSVDGSRDIHNALRGSPHAFDRLERGLAALRRQSRSFGLIHTVTRDNWDDLFATAAFAASSGATLLQLHLIEDAGRATTEAGALLMDDDTRARAFILSALLKIKHAGALEIQVDLLHRDQLTDPCTGDDIAQALGIVVLEADGTIVPIAYGFDRRFAVCDLSRTRFSQGWAKFTVETYPAYAHLRRDVDAALKDPRGPDIFNWYEHMVARSATAELVC